MPGTVLDGFVMIPQPQDGPPTTAAWEVGSVIMDASRVLWVCDVAGTPGTWVLITSTLPSPPDLVSSLPEFIDTFVNGIQTGMGWTIDAAGGGAALAQIAPPSGAGGRNAVVGVIAASTGTSSNGRAGAILGATLLRFGSGAYTIWARIHATELSTAVEGYRLRIGFLDDATSTEPADGAYFEYHSAASANWLCKTASNNTRSTVTTATAVQNADWIDLKIAVDATPTARFYINDVLVGTIITNIPTAAGRETSIGVVIHKVTGGTSRYISLDRIYMKLS